MCGRYKVSTKAPEILRAFDASEGYEVQARYNVAPTDAVPVIRVHDGKRVMVPMRWGLIPSWAKDEKVGVSTLNARVETLFEKPAFKDSLAHKRCLVVADGFYEWKKLAGPASKAKDKQPYLFAFKDGHPFAFAGLWARWKGPAGVVESCTVITVPPNPLVAPVHDRMPAILDPNVDRERIAAWLDPDLDTPDLVELGTPRDLPGFTSFPVDRRVGNVRNDDATLAEPVRTLL
jgi:putative SOS response-associated peptidase YedK